MNNRSPFRGGMQVHAVPETERAIGANGQRLPWAYEYADPDRSSHLDTREKGPFGRSTRRPGRTTSRSKTATPSRKEDKDTVENWRAIDDIFRRAEEKEAAATPALALLTDSQEPKATPAGIPTEVILYGFTPGFQYAAIEFYERVSQGMILEDYERAPPNPRYDNSLSMRSSRGTLKLSRQALRMRNTYRGGEHWIKVTYDSTEAADTACNASPHVVNGYLVYAEPYRGNGPAGGDVAIKATPAALASVAESPSQRSSTTVRQTPASETASSATATTTAATDPYSMSGANRPLSPLVPNTIPLAGRSNTATLSQNSTNTASTSSMAFADRPLRIRGAKRAILLPAEQALVPAKSGFQRLIENVPVIGWFLSGSSDIIGEGVPRREDGTLDLERAGLYWRFWMFFDSWCGSDYCGLKGED